MKKLYFLFFLIFSFCAVSAQEKLSKEEQARREKNIQAGNPFVKYGCKAPVATLSKGKYLEVHDLDSIVTIGTTRWHVDYKKIVGDIVQDTLNADAQPTGDKVGRWMSPDPLSEEFPEWSPYAFVNDNPIRYSDPTGMAPEECCDGLKGFLIGMSDNLLGRNDRSNFGGQDFNNGARAADILSVAGGTYLSANGVMNTGAGASGLASSLAVTEASGGLAIEVTGPTAAISATTMGLGMLQTAIGGNISMNAMSNLKNGSSSDSSHGNSKSSTKEQHNYDIEDTHNDNRVVKNGTSSGKETKSGESYRGNSQANKWNKSEGTPGRYKSNTTNRIPAGDGARQKALDYEKNRSNQVRSQLDPTKHSRP
ncbi:hypothetical protein [Flavobacterium aestivum]|uniref:hypothetical protein n=1 Tax=Flavobacterium aestivum TaxID=3003257 RepID=UPI0024822F82|nr:hypothetical protein [Flavobacterium aestivum]